MGVALRQAEQAAENRASSHPASTAGVQIRVDKEEYIGLRWAAAYWKARHGATLTASSLRQQGDRPLDLEQLELENSISLSPSQLREGDRLIL